MQKKPLQETKAIKIPHKGSVSLFSQKKGNADCQETKGTLVQLAGSSASKCTVGVHRTGDAHKVQNSHMAT